MPNKSELKRKICKYLLRYENTARRNCHQTKELKEVTEKWTNNLGPDTSENDRYFLNNSNGNTNNDNPGTASVKMCALLLNNGASGPIVVNHE